MFGFLYWWLTRKVKYHPKLCYQCFSYVFWPVSRLFRVILIYWYTDIHNILPRELNSFETVYWWLWYIELWSITYYCVSLSYCDIFSFFLSVTHTNTHTGVPTFILLNTTGLSPPARADQLELLSITGSVIKTLPIRYYPERKPYGIWNITDFMPPTEAFFLRVNGYDRDGFLFQRVSSVLFSSIIPGQC